MKIYICNTLLVIAVPLLTLAQIRPDPAPLTDQRVIAMAQVGVRPSEIVRIICSAPVVDFNMFYMNEALAAGVSEQAIKLMAARGKGLPCPTTDSGTVRLRDAVFFPDPGGEVSPVIPSIRREALIVPESTPVRLRLTRNLSSAHAREDDIIHFEVLEDVSVRNQIGDFIVVKRGASALGTITDAGPKRSMGRAGKVQVTIDSVRLANGDKIALRATKDGDRHGHLGLIVGLMVPTAFVDLPAAPLWLFMHGKESVIKDGFDMTAYTDGVANLNSLDFEHR
jgi:hypothetical protein